MCDFGLSGDATNSTRNGGTPLYASINVFRGRSSILDEFSYYRLMLFLCLSPPDFIQLTCFPIEDEKQLKTIRKAIKSFDVLKTILERLDDYSNDKDFANLSKHSKVKISRTDLITAGIDQTWFIDSFPVGHTNTIQSENFKVQNIQ